MTAIEDIAQIILAEVNASQRKLDTSNHVQASLWSVGHRSKSVYCADVEWQIWPANASELGREHEKVRTVDQRREAPREQQRKAQVFRRRLSRVDKRVHLVFERQHHPWIDLQGQMKVERPTARMLGMKVNLEGLTHRVGLHEMAFVVNVKTMMRCMVFQICDETRDINDRQCRPFTHVRGHPSCDGADRGQATLLTQCGHNHRCKYLHAPP